MRAGLGLLAVALAACDLGIGSDPYSGIERDPCLPGHLRTPGPACAAPPLPIVADGSTGDWAGAIEIELSPACTSPPCDGLLAGTLAAARTPAGDLALRVRLAGGAAPVMDPAVVYLLELAGTPEYPVAEVDQLEASLTGVRWLKNGVSVIAPATPPPFAFAWTTDGFEVVVPTGFLPFAGAAELRPFARRDGQAVSDPAPAARVCWVFRPLGEDPCAQPW